MTFKDCTQKISQLFRLISMEQREELQRRAAAINEERKLEF